MNLNLTPPDHSASRRQALALLASSALPAWAQTVDVSALLQKGGCAVLLRHAATVPGVGDPPGFKLEVCSTQRNLSDVGRQDARRIGAWFRERQLKPRTVLSSAWCRCKDTADLAFGQHKVWASLNSTFNDRSLQPDQSALLRTALARVPLGQFEVWVSHQVNISALSDSGVAQGEALVLDGKGALLARTTFQ